MTRWRTDALRGTALSLCLALIAFVLARYGFGRMYYVGVLLPAFLFGELLVAWLIHLKSDGFFGGTKPAEEVAPKLAPDSVPEQLYASFDQGVLPRSPRGEGPREPISSRDVMRALLWSALELGLASIALYHGAGIGASLRS